MRKRPVFIGLVFLGAAALGCARAPNFRPIVEELSASNPAIAANRQNIDFISNIAGWEGSEELLVDVDVICPPGFTTTRWAVTPDDAVRFVGVGH